MCCRTAGRGAWFIACISVCTTLAAGCPQDGATDHGPVAPGVSAALGEPVPFATPEQLEAFERGRQVSLRRFQRSDGLGPAFNVTFCGSCHERPVPGGSGGLYRNFFLAGSRLDDGSFIPAASAGPSGGVIRLYYYGDEHPARPTIDESTNVVSQRNPIPFFGVGLIAEVSEEEILRRQDPDDEDGDGISGRPNFDRGFVGRFGRKAQTVSIEGFIRGPLFNHLGITTHPLSEALKAQLPVPSRSEARARRSGLRGSEPVAGISLAQAAAPEEPTEDMDGVPDPEMSEEDLFDLVSFSMLLAAPQLEELDDVGRRGMRVFDETGCADCHTPRLKGPRGPLPVYSDLLLHDMGPDLADGLEQGVAEGSEFRTQPLWGLAAVGPYLHDGRASTVEEAILWHGGEATAARERYEALPLDDRDALLELLASLGGRSQYTPGLVPPDAAVPPVGEYGGPLPGLSPAESERFLRARAVFDRDFGISEGLGQPRMNGDSCRACHFEPVIGGAGPRGVNVMRHGIRNASGEFVPPSVGTILHRTTALRTTANLPQTGSNVFEHRQTPPLFGLGLVDAIPDEVILANADPDDTLRPDGITGRPSWTDGGQLGRFGWKAQVPSLAEFVRDAVFNEMGMTLPYREGLTFGRIHDTDDVSDPEISAEQEQLFLDFMRLLGPPPRQTPDDATAAARGEEVFAEVGCAGCHVPSLEGPDGPVPLYSDLLLHEILPAGATGVEETSANVHEFRTAPLWALSHTAPYLHSGQADTIEQAIELHDGEALAVRDAFLAVSEGDRAALLSFLRTL